MTYKEKAMEEHPEINADAIEDYYCPSDFAYDEPNDCMRILCRDCWNRELIGEEA